VLDLVAGGVRRQQCILFGALRKQACDHVGQDLDRSEWAQYAADVPYRESGCG
jgi:hypothetical protein